jgi:hypothetical protein
MIELQEACFCFFEKELLRKTGEAIFPLATH